MKPVSRAVDRVLRSLGLASEVAQVGAVDAWPVAAAAVLGPDAARTKAIAVDGDVLVVAVPDGAWAAEVRLRSGELLRRIATIEPCAKVRSIRSVVSMRT
jgi:predicted nucleic acid-binding Zn ribbon protein